MTSSFWLDRWKNAKTGFHREAPNPLLTEHWPKLELSKTCTVLVPLCGKSRDMVWLADRGHHIVGSELSPIAIDAFFENLGRGPGVETKGELTLKSDGAFAIWQGDFFKLTNQHVGEIGAVYDRAALVALPRDTQRRYALKLADLLPPDRKVLLVSLSYNEDEMEGPPFSTPQTVVEQVFNAHFDIRAISHNSDALDDNPNLKERGLSSLTESLYVLTRLK